MKARIRPARIAGPVAAGGLIGIAVGVTLVAAELVVESLRAGLTAESAPPLDGVDGPADGQPLRMAVLGDSTGAGVGVTQRSDSVAVRLAAALAEDGRRVTVDGLALPGSRTADLGPQVSRALSHGAPDLAVILIGTNDATRLTRTSMIERDLAAAVRRLRAANVYVVVGTCPDLGALRAFLHPLRELLGFRSRQVARAAARATRGEGGHPVDIGALTGPVFRADPGTLAQDQFHPSADGYRLWASALLPAVRHGAATSRV
ncbi:MAG: GDSL-type esterase/lipase family protein [Actinomycetota bacterium]|nr:GDSL-type esterase/lipase family protein [Actinomycetota bacterium]